MRSHAKAATAESTQRRAGSLGRFVRGAGAIRGGSTGADGSGARPYAPLRLAAALCLAAVALIAACATSAFAAEVHPLKTTFGPFTKPSGIGVDEATDNVFVAAGSPANSVEITGPGGGPPSGVASPFTIEGFSLSSSTAEPSGVAVDNSAVSPSKGFVYAADTGHFLLKEFALNGSEKYELEQTLTADPFIRPTGVAIGSKGTVYVADFSNRRVEVFSPAGVFEGEISVEQSAGNPADVAVSPRGDLYVVASENEGPSSPLPVYKFPANDLGEVNQATVPIKLTEGATGVTVDSNTGTVYVAKRDHVDQYSPSGVFEESFGTGVLGKTQKIAVNASTDTIYVVDRGNESVAVFENVGPTTGEATQITTSSARLDGYADPAGTELDACFFEYGETTAYGQTAPCAETPAQIGDGEARVPVHADLTGLAIGTNYHYRLVTESPAETGEGLDKTFKTLSPPAITEEVARSVSSDEAVVGATINPEGFATTFRVEYGTDTSYGQSTSVKNVGSDKADRKVSAVLAGLAPNTTYHWRIVATNEIGIADGADQTLNTFALSPSGESCANQTFRFGPSANLPDCRAYEMVSPIEKNNGDIRAIPNGGGLRTALNQSSVSGSKFTYSSFKAFGDAEGGYYSNQYLAERGADGWSSDGLNPPRSNRRISALIGDKSASYDLDVQFKAFTPDLSTAWLTDNNFKPLSADGIEDIVNLYSRDNSTGSYHAVTVNEPLSEELLFPYNLRLEGLSRDGGHVVFSNVAVLTPDALPFPYERQLYEFFNGEIRLVSVLPNGSPAESAHAGYQASGEDDTDHGSMNVDNAVSDDGSTIFWTESQGRIYARIDGERTVEVAPENSRFRLAAADGSKVLYLTGDSLYEFDVAAETQRLIANNVPGVLGASDDISYLYFASQEDLAEGAIAGEDNLYVEHNGEPRFIATLSAADGDTSGFPQNTGDWSMAPIRRSSRVTPNGLHIAFQSARSLTGYDNTDQATGEKDVEVFTYDASTDELICASCNPTGARPLGKIPALPYSANAEPSGRRAAAWLNTSENSLYTPRALSDDGGRLFFNSFEGLVSRDTNGQQDVYQWEADGVGGCKEADGCLSLISDGESPQRSEFIDADPSGANAFFETQSSLVPQDPGLIDIYDARVNGGFAPPPAPPTPCLGDACQSVPPAPNDPTPSSATFRGAGNAVPKRANRKGHKRKKQHGRKGYGKKKGGSKHKQRANRNGRTAR